MLSRLKQSDFIKNSSILIVGTVLAQLIPILIQPIIRRTYTDAETGQLDLYMSFIGVMASFVNLNYAKTIVIPKNEKSAMNLLGGSLISGFILSLIIFISFFVFDEQIISILGLPTSFKPWLKFVPFSVFLIGSHTSLTYWLTRTKKFKSIAFNKFSRRTGEGVTQVFGSNLSFNGLVLGSIIGDFINLLCNVYQVAKTEFKLKNISFDRIKKEFIQYKDFPIYSLLPTFLNTLSSNLPVIMISAYFSDKITGQFGLSRMVLAIPLALISVSLSQVLLQKVAERRQQKKSIKKLVVNMFMVLLSLSIVGTLTIAFFSEPLFTFVFGDQWLMAAQIAEIMIYYFALYFLATSFSVIFIALEEIKLNSIWQALHFIAIACLYFFKELPLFDFITTLMIINVISYGIYLYLTYKIINKYENSILKN